jgi:hypothetical protein
MPFGVIEQALKLAILLIEGTPPEQRRAQALTWWHAWWPIVKVFVRDEEARHKIEEMMRGA